MTATAHASHFSMCHDVYLSDLEVLAGCQVAWLAGQQQQKNCAPYLAAHSAAPTAG
jgi:hypothetical protein